MIENLHYISRFVSQLSSSITSSSRIHCENIPGLVRRQRILCERHPDLMTAVAEGALISVRECQRQFRNARWNCSTIPRDVSVFGRHVLRSKYLFMLKTLVSDLHWFYIIFSIFCFSNYNSTRIWSVQIKGSFSF